MQSLQSARVQKKSLADARNLLLMESADKTLSIKDAAGPATTDDQYQTYGGISLNSKTSKDLQPTTMGPSHMKCSQMSG